MDGHGSNVHILGEAEQHNAAHFCQGAKPYLISKVEPTFTYFLVELESHRVVVEVAVTPSTHPKLEKQTIYSIYYRYALCCLSISGSVANEKVRKTVSQVVGAKFLLFGWDFSDESCYTIDLAPSQLSQASCCATANERLRKYIASTDRRNEKKRKRPHIEKEGRPVKKSSDQQEEEEQATAEALVEVIRKGLSQLALMPGGFHGPRSIGLGLNEDASYADYAARLILLADQQVETQIALSWFMRFLAGCVSLASPSLPARPATTSNIKENCAIVRRQKSVARFVNMIVSGLWNRWRSNAFIVYHAFAVLDYRLKNIQTLGHKRQSKIARKTVELLHKAEAPALDFGEDQFDPPRLLCRLVAFESYQQMCDALQLPSLPNRVQPPISTSLIHAMSNRLQQNLQPRSLSPAEREASPSQSPFIGHGLDAVNTPARSSTESDSQEIQTIDSQATPSTAGYDTQSGSGVERQASGSQAQEPPSVGYSPLHEGQTNGPLTPNANSIDTLLENDVFSLDARGMSLRGDGNWNPGGQMNEPQTLNDSIVDTLLENNVFSLDARGLSLSGDGDWNLESQIRGPWILDTNTDNALPGNDVYSLDARGMSLRRDGDRDLYATDTLPVIQDGIQTDDSQDPTVERRHEDLSRLPA
ncbi:hypothetical protein GP486_005140 [Trichoglossum hirsutum]|uniref:Uncharacterized protein n=1 Tax=Trichoglossum hirsutum TaxID=265104 RepID=A0A9P8L9N7_9PEZI|nr:hypothetical protein GP486_005140 [Trichoglossum hirsutum]